jgi:hypothetical protein
LVSAVLMMGEGSRGEAGVTTGRIRFRYIQCTRFSLVEQESDAPPPGNDRSAPAGLTDIDLSGSPACPNALRCTR